MFLLPSISENTLRIEAEEQDGPPSENDRRADDVLGWFGFARSVVGSVCRSQNGAG